MKLKVSPLLFVALFLVIGGLSFGCRGTNNPPLKNQDTIQDTVTVKQGTFKPLLKLDNEGNLLEFPIPFVEFGSEKPAVDAWEADMGATYSEEKSGRHSYKTNDPKGLQPLRVYHIDPEKKYVMAAVFVKKEIFFSNSTTLTDEAELALHNAGFKVNTETSTPFAYSNGRLLVILSPASETEKYAMIIYSKDPFSPAEQFDQNRKDLPIITLKKPFDTYTAQEIKDYEAKLGLRELANETDNSMTFVAKKGAATNLHTVVYNKVGTQSAPEPYWSVTSQSVNYSMITNPEFKAYMDLNGFEFIRESGTAQIKMSSYANKTYGIRMQATNAFGEDILVMHFTYDETLIDTGGGDEPEPEKRPPFALPFFDWGAPISEDSPIIQKELNRKFEPKFKPAYTDEIGEVPATIWVGFPWDRDYSSVGNLPGMILFVYEYKETGGAGYAPGQVNQIACDYNQPWLKASFDGGNADLAAFLKEKGFDFKGKSEEMVYGSKVIIYDYYSPALKVYYQVASGNMFGKYAVFSTFFPMDTWQETVAATKKPTTRDLQIRTARLFLKKR